MLSEKLKQRGFIVNTVIWTLLGVVLLWEPGESNSLPKLVLYAAIGAVLGALQELVKSIVVKAISIAILVSLIWGTRFG